MGVYLSFSFRILTNAEALNAVESLGNIIRHRRATVVIPKGDKHVLLTVPAVSGEAIRHGYQLMLVKLASARGINVCKLCSIGEFVKHGVPGLIEKLEPDLYNTLSKDEKSLPEKELEIIKGCAVEDIAGFLIPELQIKRTSRVEVSYMLPALGEDSLAFGLDTQFHTRSAPQTQQMLSQTNKGKETSKEQSTSQSQESSSQEQPQAAQSIYYVESASAVYTFSVNIDLSGIGVASNCLYKEGKEGKNEKFVIDCDRFKLDNDDRIKRAELSIDALAELIKNGLIGGHHSSYSPHWQPISAVALITRPIQTVAYPGHVKDYIARTVKLAENNKKLLEGKEGECIKITKNQSTTSQSSAKDKSIYSCAVYAYVDEKLDPELDLGDLQPNDDIMEFFNNVKRTAISWLREELGESKETQ